MFKTIFDFLENFYNRVNILYFVFTFSFVLILHIWQVINLYDFLGDFNIFIKLALIAAVINFKGQVNYIYILIICVFFIYFSCKIQINLFINLKYIFENKKDSLYLYNKYTIYYNIIIFLLKILNNININIILIYNINLILFSYFNPFKKLK